MITAELLEKAERAIISKAERIAYERSENISNHQVQSTMYDIVKNSIIYGARLMEEELLKLGCYETEKESN